MMSFPNSTFHQNGPYTQLAVSKGLNDFKQLVEWVNDLPYGRNANRTDLGLVLAESKGTCSSKHALIKAIADEQEIHGVDLVLGIYAMSATNTPKVASILQEENLAYLPEAHCYLSINHQRYDFTFPQSHTFELERDLMEERSIQPADVAEQKVIWHKRFLEDWLMKHSIRLNLDELWSIREACIRQLQLD